MADLNTESGKVQFSTGFNYQKIFVQDTTTLTLANPSVEVTHTVAHSLGYYPVVKVWFTNANGYICEAVNDNAAGNGIPGFSTSGSEFILYYYVFTNQVIVHFNRVVSSGTTISTTVYTRIYYDKAH